MPDEAPSPYFNYNTLQGGQNPNILAPVLEFFRTRSKDNVQQRQFIDARNTLAQKYALQFQTENPHMNPVELQAKSMDAATKEMYSRGGLNDANARSTDYSTWERGATNKYLDNQFGTPTSAALHDQTNAAVAGTNIAGEKQRQEGVRQAREYFQSGSDRLNFPAPSPEVAQQLATGRAQNAQANYHNALASMLTTNKVPSSEEMMMFANQMKQRGIPDPLIRDYMVAHASAQQNPTLGGPAYQRALDNIAVHSQKMVIQAKEANQLQPGTNKPYPVPGSRQAEAVPQPTPAATPPAAAPAATPPAATPAATPPVVTAGVNEATPPAPPPPTKGPGGTTVSAPIEDTSEGSYTPKPSKPTGYNPIGQLFGATADAYSEATKKRDVERARGEEYKAQLAQNPNMSPADRQQMFERYRSGAPITQTPTIDKAAFGPSAGPETAPAASAPPAATTPGVATPIEGGKPTAQAAPGTGWMGDVWKPSLDPYNPITQNQPPSVGTYQGQNLPDPGALITQGGYKRDANGKVIAGQDPLPGDQDPNTGTQTGYLPPMPQGQTPTYVNQQPTGAVPSMPAQQFAQAQTPQQGTAPQNPWQQLGAKVGGYTPTDLYPKEQSQGQQQFNPQMMAAVEQQGMRRDQAQSLASIIQALLSRRV